MQTASGFRKSGRSSLLVILFLHSGWDADGPPAVDKRAPYVGTRVLDASSTRGILMKLNTVIIPYSLIMIVILGNVTF